jgi:hypothetical protein
MSLRQLLLNVAVLSDTLSFSSPSSGKINSDAEDIENVFLIASHNPVQKSRFFFFHPIRAFH